VVAAVCMISHHTTEPLLAQSSSSSSPYMTPLCCNNAMQAYDRQYHLYVCSLVCVHAYVYATTADDTAKPQQQSNLLHLNSNAQRTGMPHPSIMMQGVYVQQLTYARFSTATGTTDLKTRDCSCILSGLTCGALPLFQRHCRPNRCSKQ
jgi:hypothetical protein